MSNQTPAPGATARQSLYPHGGEYGTTTDVAEVMLTSTDRVRDLIDAGVLHAIDIRAAGSSRPTWRIPSASLAEFFARRAGPKPASKPKRRKKLDAYVPTYYPT